FHYDMDFGGFGRFRFQRWAADYPKSDRQFVIGVKRLTRLDARSKEHVIDAKSDDIYNYPWLYAEDPGAWNLSQDQANHLREYLLRGGFLMLDDSHGDLNGKGSLQDYEWFFPSATSKTCRTAKKSFTSSTTSTTAGRFPARAISGAGCGIRPIVPLPNGEVSATIKAGS